MLGASKSDIKLMKNLMDDKEIYSEDVPYPHSSDYLVPMKVLNNEKPKRPDEVVDTLWNLMGECWNSDASRRPDMPTVVKRLALIYG